MGRKKVGLCPRAVKAQTFVKRRKGILKMGRELAILCGCSVFIQIKSEELNENVAELFNGQHQHSIAVPHQQGSIEMNKRRKLQTFVRRKKWLLNKGRQLAMLCGCSVYIRIRCKEFHENIAQEFNGISSHHCKDPHRTHERRGSCFYAAHCDQKGADLESNFNQFDLEDEDGNLYAAAFQMQAVDLSNGVMQSGKNQREILRANSSSTEEANPASMDKHEIRHG